MSLSPHLNACCPSETEPKAFRNFSDTEWLQFEGRQRKLQDSKNLGRFFKVLTYSGDADVGSYVNQMKSVLQEMDNRLYKENQDKIYDPTLYLLLVDTRRPIAALNLVVMNFVAGVANTLGVMHLDE